MKINCYYCNYKNFGDQLNKLIFEKEIGYKTIWAPFCNCTIIGIGSIIEAIMNKSTNLKKNNPHKVYCFSCGFANDRQIYKIGNTVSLSRPVDFLAIRGELTKKLLIKNGLLDVNKGDGGLLCAELLDKPYQKKYAVGIVAHAQEKKNPIFKELLKEIPNSVMIDIQTNPIEFLKHLSQCETVISTAMHALIAADSLRIPNLWVRLNENDCQTEMFKFYDYYSAFGIKKSPYSIYKVNKNIEQVIISEYDISDEIILKKKQELKKGMLELKQYIDKDLKYQKIAYYKNLIYLCFFYYPHKYFVTYPIRLVKKIIRIIKN